MNFCNDIQESSKKKKIQPLFFYIHGGILSEQPSYILTQLVEHFKLSLRFTEWAEIKESQ